MAEYIEREALLREIERREALMVGDKLVSVDAMKSFIKNRPAADVATVRHGRWVIPTKIGHRSFDIPHCSVCNGVSCGVDENTKYCPNCGAKMDLEG